MNPVSESDVRIGIAPDIEAPRIRKPLRIAVRRANHGKHQLSGMDHLPMHGHVVLGRTHDPL